MKASDIRNYVENKGRIISDDYDYLVANITSTRLSTLTAIRLGRWLATEGSREVLKSNGYTSKQSVFLVAEGHNSTTSIEESMNRYPTPSFIAFSEDNTLVVGVIGDPRKEPFSTEEMEEAERFQKVIEDISNACKEV